MSGATSLTATTSQTEAEERRNNELELEMGKAVKELKKINLQLSIMTDDEVTNLDI